MRKPRSLEQLLDSDDPPAREAGIILIRSLGWSEAAKAWPRAVAFTLKTPRGVGNVAEAEAMAIEQILLARDSAPLPATGNTNRPIGDQSKSAALARIAIGGNPERSGTREPTARAAVTTCARVISRYRVILVHGPRGSGIMVANECNNQFQSRSVSSELVFVDRERLVSGTGLFIVIGGAFMTSVEVDIAVSLGVPVAPIPGTGGVADAMARRIRTGVMKQPPPIVTLSRMSKMDDIGRWLGGVMERGWATTS